MIVKKKPVNTPKNPVLSPRDRVVQPQKYVGGPAKHGGRVSNLQMEKKDHAYKPDQGPKKGLATSKSQKELLHDAKAV